MTTAKEKLEWIEQKGRSLCTWLTQFQHSKSKDFLLEVLPPGDIGVWRWVGGDIEIPTAKSWELGEFMIGLRSCLDIAVFQMSQEAIEKGLVKRSAVHFPILRNGSAWKQSTVSWLNESSRQRVRQAQRFGERRSYDVDIVLINALANCDKHRSLVSVAVSSAACGQIGGKNSISFSRAADLGLGPVDSQGWYTASTSQGSSKGETESDRFVTRGPLGGLAITGTIPTMQFHINVDLELDDEDDKKRLARVSVVEAIKQATYEVRDIIGILEDGTRKVTDEKIAIEKTNDYREMMASATEALQIYQNIPLERNLRSGWSMHLKKVAS
ncbi:MAG: hypothetical protein OXM01_17720 [Gemmatimonadota bacterium]|nr:hypothetical protein [Gemmatimonadota bacterium]